MQPKIPAWRFQPGFGQRVLLELQFQAIAFTILCNTVIAARIEISARIAVVASGNGKPVAYAAIAAKIRIVLSPQA